MVSLFSTAVIDILEENLRNGKFSDVDIFLSSCNLNNHEPATILSILTLTSYAKPQLRKRAAFLIRAEEHLILKLGKDRAERLLKFRR